MKRVLVTGGAGFIGGHVAQGLLDAGHAVTVFDNLGTGLRENVPAEAEFILGDVRDADALLHTLSRGHDAVFHIAGQASISKSFDDPGSDLGVNVVGTLNVVNACRRVGIRRLVFASSMTVYGDVDVTPTSEQAPCRPTSNYGVGKYAAERYVQIAGAIDDAQLAVTSLRMFNVYGERQSLDNPYQGVLAIFIGRLLRGEPITIHGDGLQTRDFVYVRDVVDAWLRVLDEPRTVGGVFNVGSGRETTINELADAVLHSFGHTRATWEVGAAPAQRGDQRRSRADIGSLNEAIGWQPTVGLTDGMVRTVEWARTQAQHPRETS